jgi:hypothetical protein
MLRIAPTRGGIPPKKVSVFRCLVKLWSIEEGFRHEIVVFKTYFGLMQTKNEAKEK